MRVSHSRREKVNSKLKSSEELLPALKEAFEQKGPAIIGIPVDYNENMRLTEHLGEVSHTL